MFRPCFDDRGALGRPCPLALLRRAPAFAAPSSLARGPLLILLRWLEHTLRVLIGAVPRSFAFSRLRKAQGEVAEAG